MRAIEILEGKPTKFKIGFKVHETEPIPDTVQVAKNFRLDRSWTYRKTYYDYFAKGMEQ